MGYYGEQGFCHFDVFNSCFVNSILLLPYCLFAISCFECEALYNLCFAIYIRTSKVNATYLSAVESQSW